MCRGGTELFKSKCEDTELFKSKCEWKFSFIMTYNDHLWHSEAHAKTSALYQGLPNHQVHLQKCTYTQSPGMHQHKYMSHFAVAFTHTQKAFLHILQNAQIRVRENIRVAKLKKGRWWVEQDWNKRVSTYRTIFLFQMFLFQSKRKRIECTLIL